MSKEPIVEVMQGSGKKLAKGAGKQLAKGAAKKAGVVVFKAVDITAVFRHYADYKKEVEKQQVEREKIWAKRDVVVKAIESQKEVLLAYFSQRFAERKVALDKFFDLLDVAIAEKNDKQLDAALAGIVNIVKDNPLSDFTEFQKAMAADVPAIEF